ARTSPSFACAAAIRASCRRRWRAIAKACPKAPGRCSSISARCARSARPRPCAQASPASSSAPAPMNSSSPARLTIRKRAAARSGSRKRLSSRQGGFTRNLSGVAPPPVRCKAEAGTSAPTEPLKVRRGRREIVRMATALKQDNTFRDLPASERKLARQLRGHLADSLLPGEPELNSERLDEAALFLFEAARARAEGEPAILVRSASGTHRATRIAVVNRDMPFLVDSIAATVAAQGLGIDLLLHPVLSTKRDASGGLAALPRDEDAQGAPESMIYLETERIDARQRRTLERELAGTLADVRAAVSDWKKMRELMVGDADRVGDPESADLLRWFEGGMLTLLGHVTRQRGGKESQRLGICRKSARELVADDTYDRAFAWFDKNRSAAPLMIKANRVSRVHRSVPLDLI